MNYKAKPKQKLLSYPLGIVTCIVKCTKLFYTYKKSPKVRWIKQFLYIVTLGNILPSKLQEKKSINRKMFLVLILFYRRGWQWYRRHI